MSTNTDTSKQDALLDTATPEDIEKLKRMLGATTRYKKSQWGFRNYFAAGNGAQESMHRLLASGLVRQGSEYGRQGSHYYHATVAGCKFIGFNKAQIVRAMEE